MEQGVFCSVRNTMDLLYSVMSVRNAPRLEPYSRRFVSPGGPRVPRCRLLRLLLLLPRRLPAAAPGAVRCPRRPSRRSCPPSAPMCPPTPGSPSKARRTGPSYYKCPCIEKIQSVSDPKRGEEPKTARFERYRGANAAINLREGGGEMSIGADG